MAFHNTINIGTTPNDGKGDGLRTNLKKLIDNDLFLNSSLRSLSENQSSLISKVSQIDGITHTGGYFKTTRPIDSVASFHGQGAIKIKFPFKDKRFRCSIKGRVDEFGYDKQMNFDLSGQISSSLSIQNKTWEHGSALLTSKDTSSKPPVRFGYENENPVIYIGDLNASWHYANIWIYLVLFVGEPLVSDIVEGWNISLEKNSFSNVSKTYTNT